MSDRGKFIAVWPAITLLLLLGSCREDKMILGAGSTFDNLLFSKMFYEYYHANGTKVNYQSIGSGGGIKSLTDEIVDFAATDAVLSADQEKAMRRPAVHIPITSSAIVISYNLPTIKDTVCFTPFVLAKIFMGKITKWNDSAVQAANPHVRLPSLDIIVVHRTDGSGTTNIFTTYLSAVNADWEKLVGRGSAVYWPVGLGGKGNEGVAGTVQLTAGAIGYTELAYATMNNITVGKVQNQAGNFIWPSVASVTAAGDVPVPDDGKVLLSNTKVPQGYPIAGLSWLLLYREQQYNSRSYERAKRMVTLLHWMIHDGQRYGGPLHYALLSPAAVATADRLLRTVTYNGTPIMKPTP